ncbi:MAG: GDP-mannose 4,6-dehydratase [candidate division WOR-3 bacterium]
MSKVMITGAAGFIGSHLVEKLIELGYEVRAFVRYNSRNYWGWLEDCRYREDIDFYPGDIRDFDSVYKGMKGCTGVIHLAALIGIPYSYIHPLAYIKTNIEGTYNILESARQLAIENLIITSTSEVYGTAQYTPIDEKHPINPQSVYAATKSAADSIAQSYYLSYNLPVKIARPFNTYGPRQSARAIIPTIITQVLTTNKIRIGALDPTRDFTFVDDIVEGLVRIFKNDNCIGEAINLGSGEEISIGELAKNVAKIIGKNIEITTVEERLRPESSEVRQLLSDYTKAKKLLGWQPQTNLDRGLRITIDWFKDHLELYKPGMYNI